MGYAYIEARLSDQKVDLSLKFTRFSTQLNQDTVLYSHSLSPAPPPRSISELNRTTQ